MPVTLPFPNRWIVFEVHLANTREVLGAKVRARLAVHETLQVSRTDGIEPRQEVIHSATEGEGARPAVVPTLVRVTKGVRELVHDGSDGVALVDRRSPEP